MIIDNKQRIDVLVGIMGKVVAIKNSDWLWLINPAAKENKQELDKEIRKTSHGTVGKYLFFSDDKLLLIKIAKEILIKYNLFNAKVPLSDEPRPCPGFGFVLCIYDSAPKFKRELRKYADEKTVKYRYWKDDTATFEGKYSKEFIRSKK